MLFDGIKIGDRFEITLGRYKENSGISFMSIVEEILGRNLLLVQIPTSYGKLVKLAQDKAYSILFFTETGMFRFDAVIESFLKQDELHMMKIRLTSNGERVQRRDFFRLPCILPIQFLGLHEVVDVLETEESEMQEGVIKDISGGGLRFVSNACVETEKITCFVELSGETLILIGDVLQRQHFPKSNYKYQYRIQFVGISSQEREKIIRYIFNEQNKIIKKIRK